jgi:hypothetical protein
MDSYAHARGRPLKPRASSLTEVLGRLENKASSAWIRRHELALLHQRGLQARSVVRPHTSMVVGTLPPRPPSADDRLEHSHGIKISCIPSPPEPAFICKRHPSSVRIQLTA